MKKTTTLLCLFTLLSCAIFAASDWNQKASLPADARHRAVGCSVGAKCYLGTGHFNANALVEYDDWWEFDPATNSWTQKANVPGGHRYGALCFATPTNAYVGLGKTSVSFLSDFYKYNPNTNTWTPIAQFLGLGRSVGTCVYIPTTLKAYMGLGTTINGASKDWYEYNSITDIWTAKADFPPGKRETAAGFEADDRAFVCSGRDSIDVEQNDLWRYNPNNNTWMQKASLPGPKRHEASAFGLRDDGFVLLGLDTSYTDLHDVWKYKEGSDTWEQKPDFDGTARRYMVAFTNSSDTKGYAGTGTNGINFNDFWEYAEEELSVGENKNKAVVSIYPNPTSDFANFTIVGGNNNSKVISLYDATGRIVKSNSFTSNKVSVNVADVASGIYYYSIIENKKQVSTGKLIIQ